jgi:cell shape-determining protein MreC
MSYLQDKKSSNRRWVGEFGVKKTLFSAIIAIFLIYIFLFTGVFDAFSKLVNVAAIPIWKVQEYTGNLFRDAQAVFLSKKALLEKNKKLKENLEIASYKLLDRNILLEENIEFKELLGRDAVGQTVFAVVLANPNRSLYDTLIIDVGKNAGIKKGDKVIYGGTIMIGEIVDVFDRSSKVLLLSSPGEEVNVIVGDENISTVAYGRGGGNFKLSLPRDVSVKEGDIVSVPGISSRVLGAIEYTETQPSDPFKHFLFKSPVNIFKIKWVEVITN